MLLLNYIVCTCGRTTPNYIYYILQEDILFLPMSVSMSIIHVNLISSLDNYRHLLFVSPVASLSIQGSQWSFKKIYVALTSVDLSAGCCSAKQKMGLIPSQDTWLGCGFSHLGHMWEATDLLFVSLSFFPFPSFYKVYTHTHICIYTHTFYMLFCYFEIYIILKSIHARVFAVDNNVSVETISKI